MPEESLEAAAFDITPEKDGGVLKTILRQGEGDATPPKGSKVKGKLFSVERVSQFCSLL